MKQNVDESNASTPPGKRLGHEAPAAIARDGWRYHHVGIPTKISHAGEQHLPWLMLHVAGFGTSPYGIEWMRFEPGAPYPEIIMTIPHVAFEVDDLEAALVGKEILVAPNSPSKGVKVAMIVADGAPVELLEFAAGPKGNAPKEARATKKD